MCYARRKQDTVCVIKSIVFVMICNAVGLTINQILVFERDHCRCLGNVPQRVTQLCLEECVFIRLHLQLRQTHTLCVDITNQGVDESVFVTELCLQECVLLPELLQILSELRELLRLQPVHLRVGLAVRLRLAVLTWR